MLTVHKNLPQRQGLSAVLLKRAASVTLDWDARQRSRFDATDSQGRLLGVFLPRGSVVRGGDVLVAEDGSLIQVIARPQAVLRISACREHGSPFDLLRAAYHLGNRHVAIELTPGHLQIEPDDVLGDMLRQMHLIVTKVDAPFEPEGGAYGTHAVHGHPKQDAQPADDAVHADTHAPHVHGPDCAHRH